MHKLNVVSANDKDIHANESVTSTVRVCRQNQKTQQSDDGDGSTALLVEVDITYEFD